MTAKAMNWAWSELTSTPLAKLILLRIADASDMDGRWMGGPAQINALAPLVAASASEIETAISELIDLDLLSDLGADCYLLPAAAAA